MEMLGIILLIFAIFCAISVSMTKDLLTSLVIFMSQSLAMSVIGSCWRAPTWPSPRPLWARASPACCCL